MLRALVITTAAVALLAAAPWTLVHAQPAVVAVVDNPWTLVTKQTLPIAIAAAEKFSGGRVLEMRFRARSGVLGFDAVIAKDGAFSHLRIDIPSNVVTVIAETELPEWMANWVLKADAKSLEKAKLHLVDAVLKAEEIADAPAVDAGIAKPLTGSNAVLAYDVEVIKDGRPERVVIDAVTGLKIANPQSLLDTWTPEEALYQSLKKAAPPR
jgi:hypothetical protein